LGAPLAPFREALPLLNWKPAVGVAQRVERRSVACTDQALTRWIGTAYLRKRDPHLTPRFGSQYGYQKPSSKNRSSRNKYLRPWKKKSVPPSNTPSPKSPVLESRPHGLVGCAVVPFTSFLLAHN